MAEEEKILSIKVDYAEAIKAIADYQQKIDDLKESEKELKKQFKDGQISQEQYREGMAASKIQTQQYSEAVRILNKEVNNSIKSDKGKDTSLRGLRAALSNVTAEYDALSREERNSAKGKELQKHINEITEELKGAEEGTGRFYRNVGNYMNSVKGAFGVASNAVIGFGAQLKMLMANPFILAIAAIATAINGIAKAIQSSEEQTNRWRIAIAPLNGVLDVMQNWLTKIAAKVLNLVEGAGKLWGKIMDLVGAEGFWAERAQEVNTAMGKRVELEKAQQALTKSTRDEIVKTAEREQKIADLRAKVAEKDKYTSKQRLAFLDEAIKLETEQAERNKALAQQRLDVLELEGSLTENDAAMNERLAEAEAEVFRAETNLLNKTRELKAQRSEVINQIKAETKANEAAAAAANKAAEAAVKKTEKEVKDAAKMEEAEFKAEYERQKRLAEARLAASKSSSQEELDLKLKLNEIALNEELRQVKDDEELKLAIRAEYAAKNEALTKEFNDNQVKANQDRADKELEIEQAKLQAMSAVMGSLVGLIEAVGESSKAAAIASKVIALAQIAIDTGAAISSGIAQAAKAGPFPANLAAIATTVATVVANMATAIKTVKSAKFSTGGDVSGEGTSTSDSIPAMLSDGESVMTAKATSMFAPILSAFNQAGGGVPIYGQQAGSRAMGEDMLAKSFAKGLAEMPAPQVAVTEIERVSNRVKVIENINRI